MRSLALLGLAAAACGGPVSPADAEPGPVLGSWAMTWQCTAGCQFDSSAPVQFDDQLDVTHDNAGGDGIHWSSTNCVDCTIDDHGDDDGSCFHVAAGDHFGVAHGAYTFCSAGGQLGGTITYTGYPGNPDSRTWQGTGIPR